MCKITDTDRMDWLEKLRGEELEEFFWQTMMDDISFRQAIDQSMREEWESYEAKRTVTDKK